MAIFKNKNHFKVKEYSEDFLRYVDENPNTVVARTFKYEKSLAEGVDILNVNDLKEKTVLPIKGGTLMLNYCNEHPRIRAKWMCSECGAKFCPKCLKSRFFTHSRNKTAVCPSCEQGTCVDMVSEYRHFLKWQNNAKQEDLNHRIGAVFIAIVVVVVGAIVFNSGFGKKLKGKSYDKGVKLEDVAKKMTVTMSYGVYESSISFEKTEDLKEKIKLSVRQLLTDCKRAQVLAIADDYKQISTKELWRRYERGREKLSEAYFIRMGRPLPGGTIASERENFFARFKDFTGVKAVLENGDDGDLEELFGYIIYINPEEA